MTSVSSLRAQFDPDGDNANKQQAARAAALRGAQLAFPKPSRSPVPHEVLPPSQHQTDARSAASVVASRQAAARPAVPVKPAQISNASLGAVRAHQRSQEALHIEPQRWSISGESTAGRGHATSESVSNVAAALAAARYSPQIPHPPRLSHSPHYALPRSHLARAETEQLAEEDQTPAQGTVNDVRQWLQALDEDKSSGKTAQASSSVFSGAHTRKTSKPSLGISTTFAGDSRRSLDVHPPPPPPPPAAEPERQPRIVSPRPIRAISVTESLEAKTRRAQEQLPVDPPPPPPSTGRKTAISPTSRDDETPPSAYFDAEEAPSLPSRPLHPTRTSSRRMDPSSRATEQTEKEKPEPPVPRRFRPSVRAQPEADRVVDPGRPVTSHREGPMLPPRPRSRSSSPEIDQQHLKAVPLQVYVPKRGDVSARPISSSGPPMLARKITPHMTGDSLANAIVAGSLASSRAPSPTKSPGPGFHNRAMEKSRLSLALLGKEGEGRTPSPAKSMRHTMRKPASSSSEDERSPHKRSRKFLIRKHPHKHNEGDRKRWRDELTALERKRYEGLWAANKGFYIDAAAPQAADSVSSIAVRDIWRRSRLPDHVLEEVWELVDTEVAGRLGRAEFVVGLWLIDQRLKGRKLPVKVQPTVWRSARGIHGLKVRNLK